jgi:putative transposase
MGQHLVWAARENVARGCLSSRQPPRPGDRRPGERQRQAEAQHVDCVRIVHKTANVLNKLPASLQGKAKQDLHAIYEAANRKEAEQALDRFVAKYGAKYHKAVACLSKDRESLLAFYDFPAEHWKHVRTSNPIESTFATVRLRTDKTRGCLSRQTALAMVFKLAKSAERHWRRLDGSERLAQVIEGVRFRDGEPFQEVEDHAAA